MSDYKVITGAKYRLPQHDSPFGGNRSAVWTRVDPFGDRFHTGV